MPTLLAQAATDAAASATAEAATTLIESAPADIAGQAASAASKAGEGALAYLAGVNWASPTWDLFIVLFFITAVFLYGLSLGRDRVGVILVSIYMSLALVSSLPMLSRLYDDGAGGFFMKAGVFIVGFVVLYFLLSRSVFAGTLGHVGSGRWWQVFLFSVFHVGLLISITLSFLPADVVAHLAPFTQAAFATETARFCWLIAPILTLPFAKAEEA